MISRVTIIVLTCALGAVAACAQEDCTAFANDLVRQGWDRYRSNDVETAEALFDRVASGCPEHIGARTGLAYTALRQERLTEARRLFEDVLAEDSLVIDALVGVGMVAWREGDQATVRTAFLKVRELEPDNGTAQQYLSRLGPELGPPPERPPLVLPESFEYPARAQGDYFEIRTESGWEQFYIKGVNLGTALPGRDPSEFPDSVMYARWIAEMGELGANAIRVYTIHPPWFYQALLEYNTTHSESPLWLIHGVWTELPPDHIYDAPAWEAGFLTEMHRVVDLLHGRADIEPRAGHAWGYYTADVSRWVLAYIIGREWEPFSVEAFNELRPQSSRWPGAYVAVSDGNAMDVWLAKACDDIVAYEMLHYRSQRPVAYTNWPTLDPLVHPTEMTVAQEVAHREAIGEVVKRYPKEYDNDAIGIDATRMAATGQFPAGVFAAFHAYPYYPDFMILDPEYSEAQSSLGASNYFGYLRDLKRHHPGMPVVIAEYGVPASLGIAHLQPQGWHHGGHTERSMAEMDERLTREIAEAGMAGGAIFAWIDEWFKKNWIVIEYELPPDRNRLWLNRLDAEQHYGLIAIEPGEVLPGNSLRERTAAWQSVPAMYQTGNGTLRAAVDEAYLWLLFEPGEGQYDELLIGFDIIDPRAGDFRWPDRVGGRLPVGVEFVLRATESGVRLLADRASNPVLIDTVRSGLPDPDVRVRSIDEGRPAGFFSGRVEQWFHDEYVTRRNDDGLYDSLRVVTNRPRFTRDGTEYAATGYDRGVLPMGAPPDGLWQRQSDGLLEVRIPWMLLNFTDPSQRRVLQDGPDSESFGGDLGTTTVESIGIVMATLNRDGNWHALPESGSSVARFTWSAWEEPTWRERRRPVFDAMRRVFQMLTPPVAVDGRP